MGIGRLKDGLYYLHNPSSLAGSKAPLHNSFFPLTDSLSKQHATCNVSSSQNNGIVERKHRHILNIARAIKFQGFIPDLYLGECVLHAAYLINRTPTPLLENKTLFEALFEKVPTFDHIKVFGCLC